MRRLLAVVLIVGGFVVIPSLSRASIQEQRERLPPAARDCSDPIAGVWKSHQFSPRYGDWSVFILRMEHVPGQDGRLQGLITNHSWDGTRQDEEPPACSFGRQWVVEMDAVGSYEADGSVRFGGRGQWRMKQVICGGGPGGYNLDHFSGVIDAEIQEFQSVNNDGGRAVNEPTVFRRVQCISAAPVSPQVVTQAPDFYPHEGGCGCLPGL